MPESVSTVTIPIVLPESATATAFCTMVNTIAELLLEAMKGQTAEQKAKMWQWYVDDVARWRKFWGLA